MYTADKEHADMELISALNAISRVSARLANNLTILAEQSQSDEGEENEWNNKRTAECCCSYCKRG